MSNEPQSNGAAGVGSTVAAVAGVSALSQMATIPGAYAAGSDEIRVGLVGCGGRGSGAAMNALKSAEGVRLVAMADAFKDRLDSSRQQLTQRGGEAVQVTDERCFVGLDAVDKLLQTDVNYVILASPPGFRPGHIKAAVAAGKHIFAEKPVAVDGAGVRQCFELAPEITQKKLALVAGTQYRHFIPYLESMKRIHGGEIGDLVEGRCYYNTTELWKRDRQPEWSDLENQMRNWLYYTWLSGDHIVEQAIHNVDAMNWAYGANPVRAMALGGRQTRIQPEFGNIYDHFTVEYEFPNGARCVLMCRQQEGCDKKVANEFVGTKGTAFVLPQYYITGKNEWKLDDTTSTDLGNAYVQEHTDAIASIRAGKPLNELKQVAESSLSAILGRHAAYTGQVVTWEEALNTPSLFPQTLTWGPMPVPPVPMPGQPTA